jgi:hypothetical protein
MNIVDAMNFVKLTIIVPADPWQDVKVLGDSNFTVKLYHLSAYTVQYHKLA